MPELPEVEVITNSLKPFLENQKLSNFWTSSKRLRSQLSKQDCQALTERRVVRVFRRAKFVVVELENAWMLIHFGMTGKIFVSEEEKEIFLNKIKHIHCMFKAGPYYIYFQDVRRFGGLYYFGKEVSDSDFDTQVPLKLGMEPLSENFNCEFLYSKTRNINQSIKSWLMSGYPIAGIGNIYASEALFRAGIRPNSKTKSLGITRLSRLVSAIKYVLIEAIRAGGSTIKDYSSINGQPGEYSKKHLVYGKKNELCLVCLKTLSIKYISQRSSFYCKECQKN